VGQRSGHASSKTDWEDRSWINKVPAVHWKCILTPHRPETMPLKEKSNLLHSDRWFSSLCNVREDGSKKDGRSAGQHCKSLSFRNSGFASRSSIYPVAAARILAPGIRNLFCATVFLHPMTSRFFRELDYETACSVFSDVRTVAMCFGCYCDGRC
jgi:hypothetical protein